LNGRRDGAGVRPFARDSRGQRITATPPAPPIRVLSDEAPESIRCGRGSCSTRRCDPRTRLSWPNRKDDKHRRLNGIGEMDMAFTKRHGRSKRNCGQNRKLKLRAQLPKRSAGARAPRQRPRWITRFGWTKYISRARAPNAARHEPLEPPRLRRN
jgi:hypothetical protein